MRHTRQNRSLIFPDVPAIESEIYASPFKVDLTYDHHSCALNGITLDNVVLPGIERGLILLEGVEHIRKLERELSQFLNRTDMHVIPNHAEMTSAIKEVRKLLGVHDLIEVRA
jgi:hypothetical protein